jgi:putative peptide zinc metalloprotease protein
LPDGEDISGRLVNKGAVLGYLLNEDQIRLRVAVPQEKAELVRSRITEVNARLFRSLGTVYSARLIAAAPESQRIIPSLGLATMAGGPFALDPSDPQQRRALRSLFVFDIELAINDLQPLVGERALIRFEHSKEPVGLRIFRGIRQLFLSQFNV